jgi:hypothetical protein
MELANRVVLEALDGGRMVLRVVAWTDAAGVDWMGLRERLRSELVWLSFRDDCD